MTEDVQKSEPDPFLIPSALPDTLLPKHPLPWKVSGAGNGHYYIDAANGNQVAHIYCWDGKAYDEFTKKLRELTNGAFL